MILKKPYAFLIKHFRLIHFILALPLIYIARKTSLIVNFFNQYVANSYSFQTGSDISSLYVNAFMLFSIVIIIIALLSIYYLLKYKEKPVKWYVVMMIYYLILFVMLFWYSSVISSMSKEILSAKAARMYRDISIIIYVPQFIFIGFAALRAVGFNLKQFNFQYDLKELQITSEDNEEVEVGFELDGYKTKRFLRRFKREFKYYLIENKLMVSLVIIILMFTSIIVYYNTRKNYNVSFSQGNNFQHQGFDVTIKDSIITNLDYKGNKISDKYYYLALKVNIKNNRAEKAAVDYDSFVINVNKKNLIPTLDLSPHFADYGAAYFGNEINSGESKDYVFAYQLDEKDIKKTYKLKILSSFQVKKGELVTKYAIVNLTPVNVGDINIIGTYSLNDKINFSNSNVGTTLLTIKGFEVAKTYIYDKKVCKNENDCTVTKGMVSPNYSKTGSNSTLLALSYDFDFDDTTSYAKHIKDKMNFFDNFASVTATINGVQKEYNAVDITPKDLTDKIVLQVPASINEATKLDLNFTIRNKRYVINLK